VLGHQRGFDWSGSEYPLGGFRGTSDDVAINSQFMFVLQNASKAIVKIDHVSASVRIYKSNVEVEQILANDQWVATIDGSELSIYNAQTAASITQIDFGLETIVKATLGDELIVATDLGNLYLIDIQQSTSVLLAALNSAPITDLVTEGNIVAVSQGNNITTMNTLTLHRDVFTADSSVQSIALMGSRVLYSQLSTAKSVMSYSLTDLNDIRTEYVGTNDIRGFDYENGRLFNRLGSAGVEVIRLAESQLPVNSMIYLASKNWQVGESQSVKIDSEKTIVATRISTSNDTYAVNSDASGEYEISLKSEEAIGGTALLSFDSMSAELAVSTSDSIELNLRDVTTDLTFAAALSLEGDYVSTPMELKVDITGDIHAVDRVNFYVKDPGSTNYAFVGVDNVAPFTMAYSAVAEGDYEAYAVVLNDQSGSTMSSVKTLVRSKDIVDPVISINHQGDLVENSDITITVNVSDEHSGIDRASVFVDGEFVAPILGSVATQFVIPGITGGNHDVRVVATDAAGNSSSQVYPLVILVDSAPTIIGINTPSSILETQEFYVYFTAEDDVELKHVYLTWGGVKQELSCSRYNNRCSVNQLIVDQRANRVVGSVSEEILFEAIDNVDQSTLVSRTIVVNEDTAPKVSLLNVNMPASVVRGQSFNMTLSGFYNIDDGGTYQNLNVQVKSGSVTLHDFPAPNYSKALVIDVPQGAPVLWPIDIVLTDRMGQTSTKRVSIPTTGLPNSFSFMDYSSDETKAGDQSVFAVKVVDDYQVGIVNVAVDLRIVNIGLGIDEAVGSLSTNSSGLVSFYVPADKTIGNYKLIATLKDYPLFSAIEHDWKITGGVPAGVELAFIPVLSANEGFNIQATLVDAGGNPTTSETDVFIEFHLQNGSDSYTPDGSDTYFGVSPNPDLTVVKSTSMNGRTYVALNIANGLTTIGAVTPKKMETIYPSIGFASSLGNLTLRYDDDNDTSTSSVFKTYGVQLAIEAAEAAGLVYSYPANSWGYNDIGSETLQLTSKESVSGLADVLLNSGVGSFTVMPDGNGEFNLHAQALTGDFALASSIGGVNVSFIGGDPSIDRLENRQVLNDDAPVIDIWFDEPVIMHPDWSAEFTGSELDDIAFVRGVEWNYSGTFQIDGSDKVTYTFDPKDSNTEYFKGDSCADFEFGSSQIVSAASLRSIVGQDEHSICASDAMLMLDNNSKFLLADQDHSLAIDWFKWNLEENIQSLNVFVDNVDQASDRNIDIPSIGSGLTDGQVLSIYVDATYLDVSTGEIKPVEFQNTLQYQIFLPTADYDGDGVSNADEINSEGILDPTNPDTDGDGNLDVQLNAPISGTPSDDIPLPGTPTNDIIYGGEGSDLIEGLEGHDYLYGESGTDTLVGGPGNDHLYGGNYDVFQFGLGFGTDIIEETGYGNKIDFLAGINKPDLKFSYSNGDLLITHKSSGDSIRVKNAFEDGQYRNNIQEITFSDGSSLDYNEISLLTSELNGSENPEQLSGQDGFDERINGLEGDDTLIGGASRDTYVFDAGFGQDTIIAGGNSTIYFTPWLSYRAWSNEGEMTFKQNNSDLIIGLRDYSDEIHIVDWFNSNYSHTVYFEYGGSRKYLDRSKLPILREGTDGIDDREGWSGADKMYGYGGSDKLKGNDGDDIIYGGLEGDVLEGQLGNDKLYGEEGNDTLLGGEGSDSLYGGLGEDILQGGARADTYYGGIGNDTLIDDDPYSTGGNSFYFEPGFGQDTILTVGPVPQEESTYTADRMIFTGSLRYTDVEFFRIDNDLLVQVKNSTDSVRVFRWFESTRYQIELMEFYWYDLANETVSSMAQWHGTIEKDVLHGQTVGDKIYAGEGDDEVYGYHGLDYLYGEGGNDTLNGGEGDDRIYGGDDGDILYGEYGDDSLYGEAGEDTLYGGVGSDDLYGGEGNDILINDDHGLGDSYHFGSSFGQDVILDAGSSVDSYEYHDRIDFDNDGFKPYRVGNDLWIVDDKGHDRVIVQKWYESEIYQIENISFDYADSWTNDFINDQMLPTSTIIDGNAVDDPSLVVLTATPGLVFGYEGNDTLIGNEANDSLYGGEGDDELFGHDGNDYLSGGLGDDKLSGGLGANIYRYHFDGSFDEISAGTNSLDIIQLAISAWDIRYLIAVQEGDDLVLGYEQDYYDSGESPMPTQNGTLRLKSWGLADPANRVNLLSISDFPLINIDSFVDKQSLGRRLILTNSDAELGNSDGWNANSGIVNAVAYSENTGSGLHYFGTEDASAQASQRIDISSYTGSSSNGVCSTRLHLTWKAINPLASTDMARVGYRFYDNDVSLLEEHFTEADKSDTWQGAVLEGSLPWGTKFIDIVMDMEAIDGAANEVGIDELEAALEFSVCSE